MAEFSTPNSQLLTLRVSPSGRRARRTLRVNANAVAHGGDHAICSTWGDHAICSTWGDHAICSTWGDPKTAMAPQDRNGSPRPQWLPKTALSHS